MVEVIDIGKITRISKHTSGIEVTPGIEGIEGIGKT